MSRHPHSPNLGLGASTRPRDAWRMQIPGFHGRVLTGADDGYGEARRVWNGAIDRGPAVIAKCTGVADVIAAVRFARDKDLLVSVRGGGHGVAGHATNDGGIMIDLSPMRWVWVHPATKRAWAGPG